MYRILLVLTISSLQLSQSQNTGSREIDRIPYKSHSRQEEDDTSVNLRGGKTKGKYDIYDNDEDYNDRNNLYHEGYAMSRTSAKPKVKGILNLGEHGIWSIGDMAFLGQKGSPARAAKREVHILKLDIDPNAVFLYFPFFSNSDVKAYSKKK